MQRSILLSLTFIFALVLVQAQNKVTWTMGMNISANTYSNMHPRVTMDKAGNPMVIWGRMSDGALFFSKWNGTAFTTPVKLNPSWLMSSSATWMGPDIASKGDTVYVVMKRMPEASDTNHIYIVRSFNGGTSFSAPVRVDFIADSMSRFPTVAIDETGNPVVGFMKFNSSFMDSRWVITRSTDYGMTFKTDVKASGHSGPASEVCDCCPASLALSGTRSAIVYRDNLSNKRDMWTGVSTNGSTSFNNGFMVDNTNWMINSCPSSGPDAIIIGDSLYTVFLSGSGSYRTYLSRTSLSGGALSVSKLTGNITGLTQQNYPRIAGDGNAVAIVWKQNVNGISQLPLLFTNNIAKGFGVFDTVDLGDITNADVTMKDGKICVVWEDDNSGTVKFRMGTYTVSTGISEPSSQGYLSPVLFPNPAGSNLNIQFTGEVPNAEIRILNVLGEEIYSSKVKDSNNVHVDLSEFEKGIYFLQVIENNISSTQKFIKD